MFCFHCVLFPSGLALAFSVSVAAANPIIWVGADPVLCDNNNLPTAVAAAPDGAVIRLANDQSYQDLALFIVDKSLSLEGGYAQCQDPEPAGMTQLRGVPSQQEYVINVVDTGNAKPVQFLMSHLEIRAGVDDDGGGGGVSLFGSLSAVLHQVDLLGHRASNGGGLRLNGPPGLRDLMVSLWQVNVGPAVNVETLRNQVTGSGGGIHCQNARISVSQADIRYNRASSNGGGVFMSNCEFRIEANDSINRVAFNRSNFHGGGFYLQDSDLFMQDTLVSVAKLPDRGSLNPPSFMQVTDNFAFHGGGGIAAHDSEVTLYDVPLLRNEIEADDGGPALLLVNTPTQIIGRRPHDADCLGTMSRCSRIAGNVGEFNAAIHATGTALSISRTVITGNSTTGGGNLISVSGSTGNLRLLDSMIVDNQVSSGLIRVTTGANGRISSSTLAGNSVTFSPLVANTDTSTLTLENSIVWQQGPDLFSGNGTLIAICSNAHDNSAAAGLETHDPGFADPASNNYRLHGDSANIDRCPQPLHISPHQDLDGIDRPQDMSNGTLPPEQLWDRGAFERSDWLFRDRFEDLP